MAQTRSINSRDFNLFFCVAALLILCSINFFFQLGHVSYIGPDEPRYVQIAREMYERGDWITPQLWHINWFEKPALTYWLTALGFKFLGRSEFAARFPTAIFSSFGIFLLLYFGRRISSYRIGFLSAFVLASSGIWIGFSRAATFDLPLAVAMEIALIFFYLWFQDRKNRDWYLCCFGVGLAMLAKGLIGILLPAIIIGVFLLLNAELLTILKNPKLLLLGCLIFLVTISTWYAPMLVRHGQSFIDEFFIQHHFQRFLTNKYKHPQPFYFFPLVVLLGCLPWTPYLLRSIYLSCKDWRELLQFRSQPLQLFLWIWFATIVGFFSISSSKLTGYILPVFPAIAILLAQQFNEWWENPPRTFWRWTITGLCALMIVGAAWLAVKSSNIIYCNPLVILQVSAALVLTAIICFSLLVLKSEREATLAMPFGLAIVLVMALRAFHPYVEFKQTTAEIAVKAREAATTNERLVFYINNHHSIDYYAPDMPLRDGHSELITLMKPEEVSQLIEQQPSKSLLVLSPYQWVGQLSAVMNTEKIWGRDRWTLVRVKNK